MSIPPVVLLIEPDRFSDKALAILQSFADVRAERPADPQEFRAGIVEADALWTRLAWRLDASVMDAAPRLRVIVTPTTGLTHIDLEAAERRGIAVLSLRGETAFLERITSTAELTWGLVLALARRLSEAFDHTRAGGWNRDALRGHELRGRTLGIIGLGRLGRRVASYGQAFLMHVLAYDPSPSEVPEGVTMTPLETVLKESDIITMHAALTPSSRGMLDERAFALMKPGVWFVNTARGELVDERALLVALESGHVAAAALDVLAGEPFADAVVAQAHPLAAWARVHPDRLLLTPHIGGATIEAMEATEVFMAEKLRNWWRSVFEGTR